MLRGEARTATRAVRARSRLPTTWPASKGVGMLLATAVQQRGSALAGGIFRVPSEGPGRGFERPVCSAMEGATRASGSRPRGPGCGW